jgi:hypothetical protein
LFNTEDEEIKILRIAGAIYSKSQMAWIFRNRHEKLQHRRVVLNSGTKNCVRLTDIISINR